MFKPTFNPLLSSSFTTISDENIPEKAIIKTNNNIKEKDEWSKMEILQHSRKTNRIFVLNSSLVNYATTFSWIVNWFLLGAKLAVFIMTSSKSILAALVDSAVDLLSQAILSLAEFYMSKYSSNYPVGRSRLEALSVIACAFIMTVASVEVIQFSITDIDNGLTGNLNSLMDCLKS